MEDNVNDNVPSIPQKRGRGRPRGSTSTGTRFNHYNPKRWEPWMDSLVMAKIASGSKVTNEELGERYNITKEHVSNILNSPKAIEIKDQVRRELLAASGEVTDVLNRIRMKALERIEKTLDNETLQTNSPIALAGVAMRAAEMTFPKGKSEDEGKKGDTNINVNGNVLIANPQYMERLSRGIELSAEIEKRRLEQAQALEGSLKLVANS